MTLLDLATVRATAWPREPYKGLDYFCAADAPLFSQRGAEIEEVAALLTNFDTRVLLLHGVSGSGKSSFLRAGVIPRLQNTPRKYGRSFFFLPEGHDRETSSDPLLIRATDDPIARIYEALSTACRASGWPIHDSARGRISSALSAPLPDDHQQAVPALVEALKALTAAPQRDTFTLLIDQAEEVLTLANVDDPVGKRQAFFDLLEQICLQKRGYARNRRVTYGVLWTVLLFLHDTTHASAYAPDRSLGGAHGFPASTFRRPKQDRSRHS